MTKPFNPGQRRSGFQNALQAYQGGRFDEAVATMEQLLRLFPAGEPNWFALLGNALVKQGKRDTGAAAFVREASLSPERAGAYLKLAVTLFAACGQQDKVTAIGAEAIAANPGDADLALTVVNLFLHTGKFEEAGRHIGFLDLGKPRHVATAAACWKHTGEMERSYQTLTEGVARHPRDLYLVSVRHVEARTALDLPTMRAYRDLMADPDTPEARNLLHAERGLNRLYWNEDPEFETRTTLDALENATSFAASASVRRRPVSTAGDRLRIGYLSNDFYDHAVMSAFTDALTRHDRSRFEITLFCYTPRKSAVQQLRWPQDLRDCVVQIGEMTDAEAIAEIGRRGIDILVDLKGYTSGARLGIVNLSDAPVRATYLGYPGAVTGVDLDYAITDRFVTPDSSKAIYREKLCRLPDTMMPNAGLDKVAPATVSRKAYGLPDDRFVFCSFNAIIKLSLRTVALWIRILKGAPDAVLWIRCDHPMARRNLLEELAANGIGGERVIFAGGATTFEEHIGRIALADASLDTVPYNGHVTSTDVLRAGVPLIVVRGTTTASRMSESLLHAMGMAELVTGDDDGYCALAIALATDTGMTGDIRARLRNNRATSPLFDPLRYIRHLERAYETMAARAREGLAPDHFDVQHLAAETA